MSPRPGLCRRCHKYAPPLPDSCRFCDSWGLFKETSGVCPACRDWLRHHPGEADCQSCSTTRALHPDGVYRLCWRRARVLARHPEDPRDRAEAVIGGHQLHLAGMEQALALTVPEHSRPPPRTGFRLPAAPTMEVLAAAGFLRPAPGSPRTCNTAPSVGPTPPTHTCSSTAAPPGAPPRPPTNPASRSWYRDGSRRHRRRSIPTSVGSAPPSRPAIVYSPTTAILPVAHRAGPLDAGRHR